MDSDLHQQQTMKEEYSKTSKSNAAAAPFSPPITVSNNTRSNDHSLSSSSTSSSSTTTIRAFWQLAMPYFRTQSKARWLFAILMIFTLLNSSVRVVFSYLARDFWSALSDNNPQDFYQIMYRFLLAMILLAPINVLFRYQRQLLAIHWRNWMTVQALDLYFTHRVYYGLEQQQPQPSPSAPADQKLDKTGVMTVGVVDNPDQRISQDVRSFTDFSLALFLTVLTASIDLLCFSVILWSILPSLFLSIVAFATVGTIGTIVIGKSLIHLNFEKLLLEANFRVSLVRVREFAESIAFLRGEPVEQSKVTSQFNRVLDNMYDLNRALRNLEFFTTYYSYLTWIVPILVIAPDYFEGTVQLGVVQQATSSFSHVLDDMSILVTQWEALAEFSAGIDRLYTFWMVSQKLAEPPNKDASPTKKEQSPLLLVTPMAKDYGTSEKNNEMDWVALEEERLPVSTNIQLELVDASIQNQEQQQDALTIRNLTLITPTILQDSQPQQHQHSRTLIQNLSLSLPWGQNLLICGSSGQGKSSLLRAIAGLWTNGSGHISRPRDGQVYFLPQKPYCATGTLRDQLLYPCTTDYLDPRNLSNSASTAAAVAYSNAESASLATDPTRRITDEELLSILQTLDLSELPHRAGDGNVIRGLDTVMDWSHMLSLGEQQRLAFGRILVNRPSFVILDESTSALDIASEQRMYRLLQEMTVDARRVSYVSVGHRPSLADYHDIRLSMATNTKYVVERIDHT